MENSPGTPDLATVWHNLVSDLQPNQRAWLSTSEPVTLHETTAIIAVPNDFTRTQLEGRLRTRLEDSLSQAFGTNIRIAVTVNPQLDHGISAEELQPGDLIYTGTPAGVSAVVAGDKMVGTIAGLGELSITVTPSFWPPSFAIQTYCWSGCATMRVGLTPVSM